MSIFAPGARVVIRDEEWLVRRVDSSSDGGYLLSCDGISDLVRGRAVQFLTKLEEDILVLDPAETELALDTSSHFNSTFLYIEALRCRSIPNDRGIHLGHRGVMNLVPYQLDPTLQALNQPRQRILMADAVGLGKTLEAGILTTELIQRGRGQRILVITLKSMLTQFQKEFWSRFSIPLVRLDSLGLQRVRNTIPSNHNPFNYYDRTIISIDTLKNNLEYRNYLENAWWDIIIIDECHNVAARANEDGLSRRARLARMLSGRSDFQERIKGDLRILEILQKKDEQANKNLGDPEFFLNVFDPEKEAGKVTSLMASGITPEQFEATLVSHLTILVLWMAAAQIYTLQTKII